MEKILKKLMLIVLLLFVMFAFIACSDDKENDSKDDDKEASSEEPLSDLDMAKETAKAFCDAMEANDLTKASKYYIIDMKESLDEDLYILLDGENATIEEEGAKIVVDSDISMEFKNFVESSIDEIKEYCNDESKEYGKIDDIEEPIYRCDLTLNMNFTVKDIEIDIEAMGLSEEQIFTFENQVGMSIEDYMMAVFQESFKVENEDDTGYMFVGKYKGEWKVLGLENNEREED
ncbi:MAG: hypothetical protein J6L69_08010 [Lachnospiraceae bacterium]|nr:hypothetical protein [Lachnospiraceae bacterium]